MNVKVIIAPNLEMIKTPASPNNSSNLIRSPLFYALWFTFLFNDQSIIGVTGLYKAFGLSFCTDDSYLTLIGSLGSISNALGRLIWGLLSDRHEYKVITLNNPFLKSTRIIFATDVNAQSEWIRRCAASVN